MKKCPQCNKEYKPIFKKNGPHIEELCDKCHNYQKFISIKEVKSLNIKLLSNKKLF